MSLNPKLIGRTIMSGEEAVAFVLSGMADVTLTIPQLPQELRDHIAELLLEGLEDKKLAPAFVEVVTALIKYLRDPVGRPTTH